MKKILRGRGHDVPHSVTETAMIVDVNAADRIPESQVLRIEGALRDIRITSIYEGTGNIQKNAIAKMLF